MKMFERYHRSLHFSGALAEAPLNVPSVLEGQVALEHATAAVTAAELSFAQAKAGSFAATARVSEATVELSEACRKARGALLGRGLALPPRAAPTSRVPRAVIRRAELILSLAESGGVPLPDLVKARDALDTALSVHVSAGTGRKEASEAQDFARAAWDDAYGVVRAAVEGHLFLQHVKGRGRRARLAVYFPKVVAHRKPAATVEPSTPSAPPETVTPAN